jgi:hypothetical protein
MSSRLWVRGKRMFEESSVLPEIVAQFDKSPYRWLVTPIVEAQRWIGFDLF